MFDILITITIICAIAGVVLIIAGHSLETNEFMVCGFWVILWPIASLYGSFLLIRKGYQWWQERKG